MSKGGLPMSIRPRRSVLFMPGSNARAIEKARTLEADCIVLDLEDSVAPDGKEAARDQVMAAERAYGLDVIDGVYNNIKDADGLALECAAARDMGFDGKSVIHPSQIETANAVFSPSAEEVAQARAIIAAFERPENQGRGVI